MDDRNIYWSVKLMIDQYGADALVEVANRAKGMQERGYIKGSAVWNWIVRAVAELQTT